MPPKPTLDIDMAEFRHMRSLMIKAQEGAKEIRHLQNDVLPKLKARLADTKGLFKGKERKSLSEQTQRTEQEIAAKLDKLPDILKEDGYRRARREISQDRGRNSLTGIVDRQKKHRPAFDRWRCCTYRYEIR